MGAEAEGQVNVLVPSLETMVSCAYTSVRTSELRKMKRKECSVDLSMFGRRVF
jgi:hypothetical protein